MQFEIVDGRYFSAFWYLENEPYGNWMAAVFRDEEGWQARYRFRYYRDDLLDETSEDRRSWVSSVIEPLAGESPESTEARLCAGIDLLVATMMAADYGSRPLQKLEPKSDRAKIVGEMMAGQPWFHGRPAVKREIPLSMRPVERGRA
jgi:hypothetical protein